MKTKLMTVGMLAALGMTTGLGACPPEETNTSAHVVLVDGSHARHNKLHQHALHALHEHLHEHLHAHPGVKALIDRVVRVSPDAQAFVDCVMQPGDDQQAFMEALSNVHLDADHLHAMLGKVDLKADDLHALLGDLHIDLALNADESPLAALAALHAQPDSKARTRTRVVQKSEPGSGNFVIVENDNTIALKLENGKIVSLQHNGKKVDLNRVKKDGERVKIMGDDDAPVIEFSLTDDGQVVVGDAQAMRWITTPPGTRMYSGAVNVEPPKAMIGVQLGEPDGMLLGHFDLEAGEATLVTGVYEGLPAGEAGLKPYDIIVAIDGDTPASQAEVREALRAKGDGDEVTLTVIHRGDRKEVKVKLVKYDQEALEKSKFDTVEMNVFAFGQLAPSDVLVAPGIGPMTNFQGIDAEKAREFAEVWRKQAEEYSKTFSDPKFREEMKLRQEAMPRATQNPPATGNNERWQRMEERLERLEKMIERLAERNRGGEGGR